MIGDFGSLESPSQWVADTVKSWDPDFIVTVGDNNQHYSVEQDYDLAVGRHWHQYVKDYPGIYGEGSDTQRFFPALGNHDWPYLENYQAFFSLPGNERYYDFVQGDVQFFVVNSNEQEPDGVSATSTQAMWLKKGLAESASAFQIVVMHHPPFTSGVPYGSNETLQWPYAEWGADAVLTGHEHLYERLEVGGIPYFTIGTGGGSNLYDFGEPIPESRVRYNGFYGAMHVTADSESMTFEFYSAEIPGAIPSQLIDRYTIEPTSLPTHAVVGRHLFYNNSTFDGNDQGLSVADDGAIAIDKTAFRPEVPSGSANYSTDPAGITGIMVDLQGAGDPTQLSLSDFTFRVSVGGDSNTWEAAPPPAQLTVRPGDGDFGSDRVTIAWPTGAIVNRHLEVVFAANTTTGLAAPDVHYWSNAVGDTLDVATADNWVIVDAADAWRVAENFSASAAINNPFDINRDSLVDEADRQIVLANRTSLAGDLDGDDLVGLADLMVLQRAFGSPEQIADLTMDALVDRADAVALAREFGAAPPEAMLAARVRPLFVPAATEPQAGALTAKLHTTARATAVTRRSRVTAPPVPHAIDSVMRANDSGERDGVMYCVLRAMRRARH
jgi:hypothetical protein